MSIQVDNLSFSYGSHSVLHEISFEAGPGRLMTVIGPNGVGKTTLFRCILGLQKHYQGSIRVDDRNIRHCSAGELAHHIAYIPQAHGLTFSFSVRDMVLMGTAHGISAFSVPGEKEMKAAEEAMEKMEILSLAERNFSRLSGGEQQLVLIARALAQHTQTILMDEPTASLDYGNQILVMSQVRKLADAGYTVLMSTHNPQHTLWYADQALALYGGRVAACGSPREIMDSGLIEKLYGIKADFIEHEQGLLIVPASERSR